METSNAGITRAGTPVRIYDVQAGGEYNVIGAWWNELESRWIPHAWTDKGCVNNNGEPRSLDIVEVSKNGMD